MTVLTFIASVFGYFFIALYIVLAWLTTTLIGTFILALAVYALAFLTDWVDPFNGFELLDWFAQLPDGYKIAISTSLLTIVGFLIAFQAATRNWQDQMRAQAMLDAAEEIRRFFDVASRLLTETKIFAELLLDSWTLIQASQSPAEIAFQIDFVNDEAQKFYSQHQQLVQMAVECHSLASRYSVLFSSSMGTAYELQRAIEAFTDTQHHSWFPVPKVRSSDQNAITIFVGEIDPAKCQYYIEAYDENFDTINSMAGMVQGKLNSVITKLNITYLVNLFRVLHKYPELLALRKQK